MTIGKVIHTTRTYIYILTLLLFPNIAYCQAGVRQRINQKLKDLSDQLKLSQPLNLGSARDCYANTLDQSNTPVKQISQMLGHSNVVITEHYLAGLNPDITFGINDPIL